MVHGFLNVRKPQGMTSHQCVAVVRRIFRTKQVGHGGTLDPMATGVLTMALGKATKLLQHLNSDKEYGGTIRFGVTTDSDDITGEQITERSVPWLTEQQVRHALKRFVGHIDQVPPRISALKKDGVRLYTLARQKQEMNLQPRKVTINRIDLLQFTPGLFPEAAIRVTCGSGTYIRSIARECGEALLVPQERIDQSCQLTNSQGQFCVGGTLTELQRTRSGEFRLNESLDFDTVRERMEAGDSPLIPMEQLLLHLSAITLPPASVHRWQIGGIVVVSVHDVMPGETTEDAGSVGHGDTIRIYDSSSPPVFLGVSQLDKTPNRADLYVLRKRLFL